MTAVEILQEFFDLRLNHDFRSVRSTLNRLKADELRTLHIALSDSLPTPKPSNQQYRFVANSESSGLAFPCTSSKCRGKSIARTALFNGLYADEVISFNPFTTFYIPSLIKGAHRKGYIQELSISVRNIIQMLPLISRGIATFSEFSTNNLCSKCFSEGLSRATDNENSDLIFLVARNYLDAATVTVLKIDGPYYTLDVSGVADFYGHESMIFRSRNEKIERAGLSVGDMLPQELISEIGMVQRPSNYLVNDLATVAEISEATGATNVLTTSSQMTAAQSYFGSNFISPSGEYTYPLLDVHRIEDAIRFRDDNWHHLVDLREFIDDAARAGENVNTRLTSEFAKIQHEFDRHQSALNKGLISDLGTAGATFCTTLATAGFSGIISTVVGILGTGHLASKIIPKLVERYSDPQSVRDSKVYYAWKLTR